MTMTPEEICRDYRAAKTPVKQIQILAELNQCGREKIKQILVEGGEKLPGNMMPKQNAKPDKTATAPIKPEPVNRGDKVAIVAMKLLRDRLMKTSLADDEWEEYCKYARGVMALWEALE